MTKFAGLRDPVTLDFENSTIAYCVDAFSISIGALMGTSPVTAFIESATGISGGSTAICSSFHLPLYVHTIRGRQDRDYCHVHWPCIFHLGILCTYICINSTLGYRRRFGHCRFAHDSEVCVISGFLSMFSEWLHVKCS